MNLTSEEKKRKTETESSRPVMQVSRSGYMGLLAALVVPWLVLLVLFERPAWMGESKRVQTTNGLGELTSVPVSDALMNTNRVFRSRPGPWGDLVFTRIDIEPPDEFIAISPEDFIEVEWFFKGMAPAQLRELLAPEDVTADQRARLLDEQYWNRTEQGIYVKPGQEVVLSLSPSARERLYSVLAAFAENAAQAQPFYFQPRSLEERFATSTLKQTTIDTIRRMLYVRGKLLLFADVQAVLNTLNSKEEKLAVIKTVSRRSTVLARLRITPQTDVNQLVSYWGRGGRAKDLEPLLRSLTKIPEGCEIDVVHLFPPFARKRLYTFPFPSDEQIAQHQDCHWSSFNFFVDPPDNRFADSDLVIKTIQSDYFPLPGEPSFGDLVFLAKPSGAVIHSAVYVADDIVFTKNGAVPQQPWTLMTVGFMHAYYSAFYPTNQPLRVLYFREKRL